MIAKLKRKIVIVITLISAVAVIAVMIAVNVISDYGNQTVIENQLKRIALNDGMPDIGYYDFDPNHNSEYGGYVDSFSILVNENYELISIIISRDVDINEEEIISYANKVFSAGETIGETDNYAYYQKRTMYGYIIVFMDIKPYQQASRNLLLTTQLIGAAAVLLFFVLAIFLARWLVCPVKETLDKQKLFISNASHELKTPLAVISANTDVLEAETGSNKWTGYIRSETERMNELVSELLCLARLDDKSGHRLVMSDTDLTNLVLQTTLPFESTVFEMGKKLEVQAQPDVNVKCDASAIKHVLTILIDNAIKYSDEHGKISVNMYTHANRRIIEVYNTGEGVPKDKLNKIFERFYRQDEARNSKSGGYGLGLAIAKSSIEAHGGKITAQSEPGSWIRFTVTF